MKMRDAELEPGKLQRRNFLRKSIAFTTCMVLSNSGCKGSDPTAGTAGSQLMVFGAASLHDAFSAIAIDFERGRPEVEVLFNFAGTQALRTQLEHGARADVFASADEQHMDQLVRSGRAHAPVVFAKNEPVLVVSREAAHLIRSVSDLPRARRIVLAREEVPIGRYSVRILDRCTRAMSSDFRARVESNVVSRELSTRQVLTKVRLGEAEAGIVYKTDVAAASDVTTVAIPAELNVFAEYLIALVTNAEHPGPGRAWVEFVLSEAGQSVLGSAGFLARGSER